MSVCMATALHGVRPAFPCILLPPRRGKLFVANAWTDAGERIKGFASQNFMSLLLLGGITLGMLHPGPGRAARQLGVPAVVTAGTFFLSGSSLQDEDFENARREWPCALLGLGSILFITPMAALPLLRINLHPKELVTGLAVFCCAPTTLSTGVALAQLAGGNKALALALTVVSNCLGVLTMPFFVSAFIARGLGVAVPAGPLLLSMVQTLLVPLLIGKALRNCVRGFRNVIDGNRQAVSFVSAFLISMVPWMQISCSRSLLLQVRVGSLLACAGLGICLHLVFLAGNYVLLAQLPPSYDKASTRATMLVASQKTLPVSMAVLERLNNQLGETGLLLLPCICAHALQIMLDSMLVNLWLQWDGRH